MILAEIPQRPALVTVWPISAGPHLSATLSAIYRPVNRLSATVCEAGREPWRKVRDWLMMPTASDVASGLDATQCLS
jgi:hypothetical protein